MNKDWRKKLSEIISNKAECELPEEGKSSRAYFYHLDEHQKTVVEDFIESLLREERKRTLELIEKSINSVEPSPVLDTYLEIVKHGTYDTMYDYGVLCERKKLLTITESLKR